MFDQPRGDRGRFQKSQTEWGKGFYVRLPQPYSDIFEAIAKAQEERPSALARELLMKLIDSVAGHRDGVIPITLNIEELDSWKPHINLDDLRNGDDEENIDPKMS